MVFLPFYGLLNSKDPQVLYFSHESLPCCLTWGSQQQKKAFSEYVRMKPSVWLRKGNFRRLNIFSKFVNCQDTGWDLYTKYNKYHRGISLTANYQELPLLSCGKMHYLNLVLWSFVNKLRQENKTISSSLLSCKIAQQWDALWDWRSESMERCVQSFSCFLASFPLTLPSIFCDMYMWNF